MTLPLRIVFFGSDPIALPALEWISGPGHKQAQVVAVFTQPDKPVGRGQSIVPNGIKAWALARGLPVLQPDKLTEDARVLLAGFKADVSLVMAYGHILRDDFIATPRLGTLNLHASLLPKYRGASPIQTAIASGERETGVALMRIVRKLDAGPVADVERVPIDGLDTAAEVEAKLAAACPRLLSRNLGKFAEGLLAFTPQDDSQATFCRRLIKADGLLDFGAPASELAARVNGLFPWPTCSIVVGETPLKIGLADALDELGAAGAGTVLGADSSGILVACGRGILRLRRLQRPGGKMLAATEFARGFPIAKGTLLVSDTMKPLVSSVPFRH